MNWVQGHDKYCNKHHAMRQASYEKYKEERARLKDSPLYRELLDNRSKGKQRQYNQTQRDAESVKFYRSKQWKQVRNYRIAYDQYVCQCCGKNYQVNRLTADHITMRKLLKPQQQLDWHNLWTLCNRCNAIKQQIEIDYQHKNLYRQLRTMNKNDWKKLILKKENTKNTPGLSLRRELSHNAGLRFSKYNLIFLR